MNYKRIREYPNEGFNEEYPFNKKCRIDNGELNFNNPPDYIFNRMKIPRKADNQISSNVNIPLIGDSVSPILPPFPQVENNFRKMAGPKTAIVDNPELAVAEKPKTTTPKQLKYFRCEQCGIFLSSQVTLDTHLAGSRHAKKLKELELNNDSTNLKKNKVKKLAENEFFCKLCKVKAPNFVQIKSHIDGKQHKKNMKTYRENKDKKKSETIEELLVPNNKTTTVHTDEKKSTPVTESAANSSNNVSKPAAVKTETKLSFYCDLCGLSMNSQMQYDQHVNSKKHSTKVTKLRANEN